MFESERVRHWPKPGGPDYGMFCLTCKKDYSFATSAAVFCPIHGTKLTPRHIYQ